MKKSIKILTLVLSLALICGALVVAAFAEGETEQIVGVRLDNSADMEGQTMTEFPTVESKGSPNADESGIMGTIDQIATNADRDNNNLKWVQFKHQIGNTAIGKIVSNPIDGNKYITVEHTGVMTPYDLYNKDSNGQPTTLKSTYKTSNGHMLDSYTLKSGWNYITNSETRYASDKTTGEYLGIDTKYFVMDADLAWFDPANYDGSGFFRPYIGYTNAAGSGFTSVDSNIGLLFVKEGNQVAVKIKYGDNTKVTEPHVIGSDGSWSHVTYIMGFEHVTDDNGTNLKIKQWLAIDGVIVDAADWTNTKKTTEVFEANRTLLYTRDIRFDVFGKVSTTKIPSSGAIDNYKIRTILPDYNGNLSTVLAGGVGTNLSAWESNLYDASKMPEGIPVAKVGETYYTDLQDAVDAANEGDTITLCANVTDTVTINKALTINCGDYTLATPKFDGPFEGAFDDATKTYEVKAKQYSVVYVKGGVTMYGSALKDALENADADTTVTLAENVSTKGQAITIANNNVTLDLNGFMIDNVGINGVHQTTKDVRLFTVKANNTFTIKGEKEGSAIVSAFIDKTGNAGTTFVSSYLFVPKDNCTINLIGKNLNIAVGQLLATWEPVDMTLNIDGGCYMKHNLSDGNGFIYYSNSAETNVNINIKNAVWGGDISFANQKDGYKVSYENCYLNASVMTSNYNNGHVTVKNCIIEPEVRALRKTNDNRPHQDKNITLIGNNFYQSAAEGVIISDGLIPVAGKHQKEVTYYKLAMVVTKDANGAYVVDPSSYVLNKVTETRTYNVATVPAADVDPTAYTFTAREADGTTYYSDDFTAIASAAPSGTVIDFNSDYYMVAGSNVATIRNGITINLNGYTLGVSQSTEAAYILIDTTETVTVNGNGGMIVASDNKNINTVTFSRGYPIFRTSKAADLVLNDVNTCTGAIFYHHGASDGAKLTVNGGEHYGIYNTVGTYSRGLVASRSNTTVVFNDAKIYMNYLNSLAYSSHSDSAAETKLTTFTYNNCYIVQSGDTHSLVRDINANTYLYFNDSYVYGLFAQEKNKGTYTGANIVFGEGSFWGSSGKTPDSGNYKADVNFTAADFVIAEGYNAYTISNGMSTKYEKYASGDFLKVTSADKFADTSANTFKTSAQTGSKFTYSFAVLNASDIDVEYVKDGKTHYAVLDDNFTFASVVENAQAGTTIKLHDNVSLTGLGTISIKKSLTIDLNGKTMSAENSGQNYILKIDAANVTFTLANGTLIYKHAGANTTHAFMDVYSDLTGVVVNFNNLTTYTGMLLRNYAGNNVQVNINGGEHHMVYQPTNLTTSYIESRANITLKANNAKFYLGGYSLFASCSYKQSTGDKASSFTYINCQILQTAADKHVVQYANNNTTATFDNCKIYGKIQPAKNGWDGSDSNPTAGSFKLINGTTYMDGTTFNTAVDVSTGYKIHNVSSSLTFDFANDNYDATIEGTTVTISNTTDGAWYKVVNSGVDYYYSFPAGTKDSLTTVIGYAGTDSDVTDDVATLVLLKDIEINLSESLTISKNLTIDLGGHTLYIEQGPVYNDSGAINGSVSIVTSKSVKFMNGTIMLAANSEYGSNKNDQKVSAIVQPSNGAKIYFKDVNTYGYAITYSWGNAYSVYVDGGEHHVNAKGGANMSYSGWICGGNNITAEVKNATVYLENTAAYLVTLSHYKAGDTKSSVATFDNCTIVASSATHNIIPNMNNATKITFTNSDIFGKIDPTAKPGMDSSASVKAEKGAIVIGAGCRISDNVLGGVVVLADGIKLYDADMTETLTSNKASSLWNLSGFTLSGSTQNVTYNLADVTTATGVDFVFEYVKGGITYWTPEIDTQTTFNNLFSDADKGSTIKLLRDFTLKSTAVKYVQKSITLDLNGFTLTHQQSFNDKREYAAGFLCLQEGTFTIKNGTIRLVLLDGGVDTGKNYSFIRMDNSDAVTKNVVLNIENVNTYAGTFVYNQTITGATINIIGGEHYLINGTQNVMGSFIETRANTTVTVTGAKIYLDKANGIAASVSYKTKSGVDKATSYVFTDCEIFATSASKNLIPYSNEFTTFTFNNCKIVGGKIAPAKHTSFEGSVVGPQEGSVIFGIGTTYLKSATLNYVVFEAGCATSEGSISIVFTDSAIGTKTATGTIVEVGGVVTNPTFVVKFGDQTTNYENIFEAIAHAPAGATIYMLGELPAITLDSSIIIDKALTIDLGGYHLQIIQNAKNAQIFIRTADEVVFQNGRISCAASKSYGGRTKDYDNGDPLFVADTVAVNLKLDGISTYTATIIYNTKSGSNFTVIGGYHEGVTPLKSELSGMNRGLVLTSAGMTTSFKDASIYMDYCSALLAANSTEQMTFTYDNCVVYMNDSSHRFIRVANDKTFVYFNGCEVYGAFAQPTNSTGGKFTSANLHFDKDTKWGYPSLTNTTIVSPTLPEGYVFLGITSETISYEKFTVSGKFYNNNFDFADTATTGTITVNTASIVKSGANLIFMIEHAGAETYMLKDFPLADAISRAPAGSTFYILDNYVEVTDRYLNNGEYVAHSISINKKLTIDFCGNTFTFEQHAKNCGFYIGASGDVTFRNGTIITKSHSEYTGNDAKTFPFANASGNGAKITFDGVNSAVCSLVYSYGSSYTVNVIGGTHTIVGDGSDMNTPGFISGQAKITANITGATIFVESGYLIGTSSYRLSGEYVDAITSYTFTNCDIIARTPEQDVMLNANEFTRVYFNNCRISASIVPNFEKDGAGLSWLYNEVTGKYAYTPTHCTCGKFADTKTVDGKCDSCSKYNPAYEITKHKTVASTAANFIIGKDTYFSASSNLGTNATLANKLIAQSVAKTIIIGGVPCSFDYVADYVYVIWYDANGKELERVPVDESFTGIVAPDYVRPESGNNGWYQIGGFTKDGWTTTFGGTKAAVFSEFNDFSANLHFYPQANENIAPYLSKAMYNLSIVGSIRNNFYIPVDMPENVKILSVYIVDENGNKIKEVSGTEILFKDHRNEPVYYTMYVINYVDATALTETTRVWVDYTVNDTTLTQKYTISPEKYVNTVYADSQAENKQYNNAAYTVVADLVRYSYFISEYANVENTDLTDLYNKMSVLCSELPENMDPDKSVDTSAIAGLGSIAFEASEFNPRWKFTLNESAQITGIKITLQGYNNGFFDNRTNFGTQTYGITKVNKVNGYITEAYTENIPVYNLTQPFTITMTKADETEISATFDLNSYYESVKGTTAVAEFLKSVVALANSTIAYKFPDGKVTVNDVAKFWECDHPENMVNKLDEVVSYTNVFKPRYCQKCDSYLFYYEDYGAVADGKTAHKRATHISGTNDYEAIYWTHANANEWKARTDLSGGKHVAVIGNSDPTVAKNYYISLPEGRGLYQIDADRDGKVDTVYKEGKNLGTIVIATDTSWNGVNLLIDDDMLCNSGLTCECEREDGVKRSHRSSRAEYVNQAIFTVDEYGSEKVEQNWKGKLTSLSAGATNIGFAPGRDMLVKLTDAGRRIYLRYGSNASSGDLISEVILVHADGTIDASTPVQWDYELDDKTYDITYNDKGEEKKTYDSVIAYAADATPIKISGLDANGEINAIFETYVNNDVDQYLPHYEQCGRNITIKRSNATVEGLDRIFLEEKAKDSFKADPNGNDRMAYTFIKVELCSDATIKHMKVMNHNNQAGDSGTGQGSYEFNGSYANAVKWENCETKNMFSDSDDGELRAYAIYRGLFGTNHIRNMHLADCYLNSFDSHTGAYNVTIERSTFDHMNFIGGGLIKLTDVTVYTDKDYGSAINLRKDYGSTWNGDLEIDGLTVRYGVGDKPSRITLLYGSYVDQYWGFDTYMPQNVTINNFHVESYTATVEDTNGDGIMDKRIEKGEEYTITHEDIDRDGIVDKRTEVPAENGKGYGETDSSTMQVYYYYGGGDTDGYGNSVSSGHIHKLEASKVPATSEAGDHGPQDKGDSSIKYDYGTNHLVCTKNLTITNSVTFVLPVGDFWKDMNFTMNGSKYVWTEKKIGDYVYSAKFEKQ